MRLIRLLLKSWVLLKGRIPRYFAEFGRFFKSDFIIRAVSFAHNMVFGKMQEWGGEMHKGGVKIRA